MGKALQHAAGWLASRWDRYTLAGQLRARLLLILAVCAVGVGVAASINYRLAVRHDQDLREEALRLFYTEATARYEAQWRQQAGDFRRELEFLRVLENLDAAAKSRLTAFLTAKGEHFPYYGLGIEAGGQVLFAYGQDVEMSSAHVRDLAAGAGRWWSHHGEIHHLWVEPVWLGPRGYGRLVLVRRITPGMLQALQIPHTRLSLALDGVRVESGRNGTGHAARRHVLPWGGTAGPTLEVEDSEPVGPDLWQFLRQPALVLASLGLLLWWALGRWGLGLGRRVAHLRQAGARFGHVQTVDQEVAAHLAAVRRADEVGAIAESLHDMMEAILASQREARAYAEILEQLEEAVLDLDPKGRLLYASAAWGKLSSGLAGEGDLWAVLTPEARASLTQGFQDVVQGRTRAFAAQLPCRARGGDERWLEWRLLRVRDGLRAIVRDVTEQQVQSQRIAHMALHDALTNLPNRVLLEDRILVALRGAERDDAQVAVCFIDLDHFKEVNDTLGHKAGDELLLGFVAQVRQSLRASDTLARWGGDEFVLLLPDMPHRDAIRVALTKVREAIQVPIAVAGQELRVTFSMGVAVYPQDGQTVSELLARADRAMYHAKAQGRNDVVFSQDMEQPQQDALALQRQSRLAKAIEEGRIVAWFQPIVAARDRRVLAVEALARWYEPKEGWIAPSFFIPLAENLGLVRELGRLVWQQTLAAGAAWRAAGHPVRLGVNLSKRQLFKPFFVEELLADVAAAGLTPADVLLEVTESVALMDVTHAADRLDDLAQAGFRLALDDFGTGYSSLSQLHEMPVHELKIDQSFVRRLHAPGGERLVQAMVQMCQALGIATIAEGVEDEATAQRLTALGVTALQGYHFARPMPREQMDAWLRAADRKGRA